MHNYETVLKKIAAVVGKKNILRKEIDLLAYSYAEHITGLLPLAVVFLKSTAEVAQVLKLLHQAKIPAIPRGAGTNLCGGTAPLAKAVILEFAKMDRILEVDIFNRYITVEPGVTTIAVQKALEPYGYFFAPDPASIQISTIGGNIAENAGGMRCVKYGVTSENVLGIEVVFSDGQVFVFNGPLASLGGYDLTGIMHGSEGTLGVITKAWLRILKLPETVKTLLAAFATVDDAVTTVARIIAQGIIPSTVELIDGTVIRAVEENFQLGYPADAQAVLLIEIDGFAGEVATQVETILSICQENRVGLIQTAGSEEERQYLWTGRLAGLNCLAAQKPAYAQEDIVVPRAQLPAMFRTLARTAAKHSLLIGTVCHAGDGNSHPAIFYDDQDAGEKKRMRLAFTEIMETAISLGGTITGEHGVGIEKLQGLELLFSQDELLFMQKLKSAFDPQGLLNPGKAIPEYLANLPAPSEKYSQAEEDRARFLQKLSNLERVPEYYVAEKYILPYIVRGQKPWCVVKPQNSAEVQVMVQLAAECNISLLPWGKGTKIIRVEPQTVILDLSKLNRILEVDGANLTTTVEAGVDLHSLRMMLLNQGQLLAVDPLESGSPTVGGTVATDSTGSLQTKFHTLKNLVLGIEIIDAQGKIISYGGKTIKNVAGYDLRKLLVGSWGKLGVITKVTLKLYPLPETAIYRTYLTENHRYFTDFIFNVRRVDLEPISFDLVVHAGQYFINICTGGFKQSVERQLRVLNKLARNLELVRENEDKRLLSGQTFFSDYFPNNISPGEHFVLKSSVLFAHIPAWVEKIRNLDREGTISIYGHLSSGVMSAMISSGPDTAQELMKSLQDSSIYGTHLLVGNDLQMTVNSKNTPEQAGESFMAKRLKEIFDPKTLFGPPQLEEKIRC